MHAGVNKKWINRTKQHTLLNSVTNYRYANWNRSIVVDHAGWNGSSWRLTANAQGAWRRRSTLKRWPTGPGMFSSDEKRVRSLFRGLRFWRHPDSEFVGFPPLWVVFLFILFILRGIFLHVLFLLLLLRGIILRVEPWKKTHIFSTKLLHFGFVHSWYFFPFLFKLLHKGSVRILREQHNKKPIQKRSLSRATNSCFLPHKIAVRSNDDSLQIHTYLIMQG